MDHQDEEVGRKEVRVCVVWCVSVCCDVHVVWLSWETIFIVSCTNNMLKKYANTTRYEKKVVEGLCFFSRTECVEVFCTRKPVFDAVPDSYHQSYHHDDELQQL